MTDPLPPVLIVDDEKNMRRSLQTMLTDEGYSVRAAESAEEALTLLGQETFFMVITDARLGGMSGYELLGKIRTQWPDVAALMITAYATPKLAVEASRPAPWITSPNLSPRRNSSWPSPAPLNVTASSAKTPPSAPAPPNPSASTRSSAIPPKCANSGS